MNFADSGKNSVSNFADSGKNSVSNFADSGKNSVSNFADLGKNSVSNFADSPVGYRIHLHIGDACQILPQLNLMFDLVFIDANKWHFKKFGRSSMPFPIRRW